MTKVDSHHHLWPADVIGRQDWRPAEDEVLRRAFDAAEFHDALDASGLDGSILMQSVDSMDENQRLAAYAAASERILGWVGYADLPAHARALDDVGALVRMREAPGGDKLVGLRCLVGSDPMSWTAEASGIAALQRAADEALVWDTVPITDAQTDAVAAVAERLPHLRIVVDHLASPPMADDAFGAWRDRLQRLAAPPNVAVKLSVGVAVLQRWERWDAAALRPYVQTAIELFGARRSMLASNWPVVLLRASHAQAWSGVLEALGDMDVQDRARVEGGTALDWYGVTRS
jgi:L-fuconolactonase